MEFQADILFCKNLLRTDSSDLNFTCDQSYMVCRLAGIDQHYIDRSNFKIVKNKVFSLSWYFRQTSNF